MAAIPHPALTVTNIRNFIPITLELENGQYTSWVERFAIPCTVFEVLGHIIEPKATSSSTADKDKEKETSSTISLDRLDAIVKQWIYSTISNDQLLTIIKPKATAKEAWDAIAQLFQENQASRAITLKNRLTNTKLETFPNISTYCQELKVITDQLSNVEAPILDADLVLQMVSGLTNTAYDAIGMCISQTIPLPTLFQARTRLTQEEPRRSGHVSNSIAGIALHTALTTPHYVRGSHDTGNES
ncbi:uncharacterized protein LOC143627851 [Bidens hawaiensis]|uniref:uncharacterized protein LOC143627851 n=1 Tax=Bidens hawaiensis TaxID=980011 RepID=UPI0040497DFB